MVVAKRCHPPLHLRRSGGGTSRAGLGEGRSTRGVNAAIFLNACVQLKSRAPAPVVCVRGLSVHPHEAQVEFEAAVGLHAGQVLGWDAIIEPNEVDARAVDDDAGLGLDGAVDGFGARDAV